MIHSLLDAQGKTVDIPDSTSFDYKVFQFLIQAKTKLAPNIDTNTYTIDISSLVGSFIVIKIVKNVHTDFITIGDTIYNDNKNAKVVYTGTTNSTDSASQLTSLSLSIINTTQLNSITSFSCFNDITINNCTLNQRS